MTLADFPHCVYDPIPQSSMSKVCICNPGFADASCNVPVTVITSANNGVSANFNQPGKSWRYYLVNIPSAVNANLLVQMVSLKHQPSILCGGIMNTAILLSDQAISELQQLSAGSPSVPPCNEHKQCSPGCLPG